MRSVLKDTVCFRPIGVVEKGLGENADRYGYIGVIRIYEEYAEGLRGLEEYSHIYILWVMHRAGAPSTTVSPRILGGRRVGVFSTRSPRRPNPIGLTLAELVSVKPPRLYLKGLDAWTGSPVLDIKPYTSLDAIAGHREPAEATDYWRKRRNKICKQAPWLLLCREQG